MKLLWISHNVPYPPKTGVLQRNFNLVREAARHAEIDLVAVLQEDILPGPYDLEEAKRALGRFCSRIEVVRLPIEESRLLRLGVAFGSLFTRDPYTVNWAKSRALRRAIRRQLRDTHYDVVHFDTVGLAHYRADIGDAATILNHHNVESQLLERRVRFEGNPLKRTYYRIEAEKLGRFERRMCPRFDVNFTVSELDADQLRAIAPSARYEVIANGVDVEYFAPPSTPPKPGSMIMVSGMNWFPNRDAVLHMSEEIWPLLSRELPESSWTVVGASPPRALLDLAERDDRVTVTGFVDDVRPHLAEAETYLCPMRDGGGTRLKILDAFAMEKAVVATRMACEGIAVTPEQNVLIADTPEEFVAQISRVQSDPDLRERLGREGRRLVTERYAWGVIGEKLGGVYADLRARTAGRAP